MEKESQMNDVISIVVPVYKVENEIDRCVKSLLSQTYTNIEIILVDDGSPDNCPKICDEYAKKDGRVSVVHKQNGGLSDARNAGLKVANGKYILYVDSDDYIDLDTCQRFIDAVGGEEDIDIIVGNAIMHKENATEMITHNSLQVGKTYDAHQVIKISINAKEWYAPACLNMYRKEFLISNELFFKVGIYFEDMQMLPRVFLTASKIRVIEGTFYHYIIRNDSITTSVKNAKKENDTFENLAEWKEMFDKVSDVELRKYLYGMLMRCYLHECRLYKVDKWILEGLNIGFAVKYSLDWKEKMKALVFGVAPNLYIGL